MIPEFAIIGHPNEGKSSVLSTLAEDDSVRISDTPGETRECRTFPVIIDDQELLRFTDTPGFQNPGLVLTELQKRMSDENPLHSFRHFAQGIAELQDDYKLLEPVARGAGIIYVVDGSRPIRRVDRMEMEILRLTGKPRMAIINNKEKNDRYIDDWKAEFRRNFNSSRTFNAHRATYAERILLLEALKSIEQDWQKTLGMVVDAIKKDWSARNETSAAIIVTMLKETLSLSVTTTIDTEEKQPEANEKLWQDYTRQIALIEQKAHQQLRGLYKHNIFNYQLPPHSPLRAEIFDQQSWQLLGLTRTQLMLTGVFGGAAAGLGLDAATLGHSFGLFAALGGALGGFGAIWGSETISNTRKLFGLPLPSLYGQKLQIGPAQDINLLFVLLNRSLLYYQHIINWAHGRRDYETTQQSEQKKQSFTSQWPADNIKTCRNFFAAISNNKSHEENSIEKLIRKTLDEISGNQKPE